MTQWHWKPRPVHQRRASCCVLNSWCDWPEPQFAPVQGTWQPNSYMRLFQSSPQLPQSLPDQQQNWLQLSPEASFTSSDTGASLPYRPLICGQKHPSAPGFHGLEQNWMHGSGTPFQGLHGVGALHPHIPPNLQVENVGFGSS